MKILIKKRKVNAFKSEEGDMIEYFWYTAERKDQNGDPVRFQFGSKRGNLEEGEEYDLDLYKNENGKWKEEEKS